MKFTESHEWIELDPKTSIATVGVSDHAQKELGEIVYVELPEIGSEIQAGKEVAVLESTKAAADVYSPVTGVIVDINPELSFRAGLINQSPENEGWIFKIKVKNRQELDKLMDAATYRSKLGKS